MLDPAAYDNVIVTVAHPWGDVDTRLTEWVRIGPGPRTSVQIVSARWAENDNPIDMDEIPAEYHNSEETHRRQRLGELPTPWGPPPDEPGSDPNPEQKKFRG